MSWALLSWDCWVSKKLVLTILMVFGAFACIGLGVTLLVRSFAQSSSMFATTMESMQKGDEFQQYLSMVSMAIGLAVLVFVKKYWS